MKTATIKNENQLENMFATFIIPGKEKPIECSNLHCICDEFKASENEGPCKGGRYTKNLRSKKQQKALEEADEKRKEIEKNEALKKERWAGIKHKKEESEEERDPIETDDSENLDNEED